MAFAVPFPGSYVVPLEPPQRFGRPDGMESNVLVGVLGQPGLSYYLPPSHLHQVPVDLQPFEQLVLCPAYDPNIGVASCGMGFACRLVHADVRDVQPSRVHINYSWRSAEQVTYPRYPAGQTLQVAPPHSRYPTDVIDSGGALVTRALEGKRRPLTHCAHYYLNRQCNMGSECHFIHAVYIDPNTKERRRAPAPVQIGRPRVKRPQASFPEHHEQHYFAPSMEEHSEDSANVTRRTSPLGLRPVITTEAAQDQSTSSASSNKA
jgi:hypothetical protein